LKYKVLSGRLQIKEIADTATRRTRTAPYPRDADLRTAHVERERERERTHLQNNIKTKSEQLKLSKIYLST
jgi:hypothetical protein